MGSRGNFRAGYPRSASLIPRHFGLKPSIKDTLFQWVRRLPWSPLDSLRKHLHEVSIPRIGSSNLSERAKDIRDRPSPIFLRSQRAGQWTLPARQTLFRLSVGRGLEKSVSRFRLSFATSNVHRTHLRAQARNCLRQTYPSPQGGRGRAPAGHSFRTGMPAPHP